MLSVECRDSHIVGKYSATELYDYHIYPYSFIKNYTVHSYHSFHSCKSYQILPHILMPILFLSLSVCLSLSSFFFRKQTNKIKPTGTDTHKHSYTFTHTPQKIANHNIQAKDQDKNFQHRNMKQNVYKIFKFILCWPSSAGHRTFLK